MIVGLEPATLKEKMKPGLHQNCSTHLGWGSFSKKSPKLPARVSCSINRPTQPESSELDHKRADRHLRRQEILAKTKGRRVCPNGVAVMILNLAHSSGCKLWI